MPRFAANLTMMFTELPFLSRFAAAEEGGFDAVEFLFPYEFDKGELASLLAANGRSTTPRRSTVRNSTALPGSCLAASPPTWLAPP